MIGDEVPGVTNEQPPRPQGVHLAVPLRFRALVLFVFATTLLGVAACSSDHGSSVIESNATAAPSASESAFTSNFETHPPLTGAAASSVFADIGSGDQARITSQIVLPASVSLDPSAFQQLQSLTPINADESSFKQLSDTEAQLYAKVGADQKDWTLLLQWQDNRWQLADTLEGRQ